MPNWNWNWMVLFLVSLEEVLEVLVGKPNQSVVRGSSEQTPTK